MTVLADCAVCDSTHPLGARKAPSDGFQSATVCPDCGSRSYRSQCNGDGLSASDIRELLYSVDGVGATTHENIVRAFPKMSHITVASVEQLTRIDGVGQQTATRIQSLFD
jgi:hypothetical protein